MPAIFERKLFKIGEGGIAVTLPKPWINFYGLQAGDKVEILVGNDLVIRPRKPVDTTNPSAGLVDNG
jgi:antitoxin component of MazEF toxin-antitoxin module